MLDSPAVPCPRQLAENWHVVHQRVRFELISSDLAKDLYANATREKISLLQTMSRLEAQREQREAAAQKQMEDLLTVSLAIDHALLLAEHLLQDAHRQNDYFDASLLSFSAHTAAQAALIHDLTEAVEGLEDAKLELWHDVAREGRNIVGEVVVAFGEQLHQLGVDTAAGLTDRLSDAVMLVSLSSLSSFAKG